jgi:hypothetical protein
MRIVVVFAVVLMTLPLRMFAAEVPVGEDILMSFLIKMLAEAPLAASLIGMTYLLRPVLKLYLDQQIEQLKLIATAITTLGERLDRVEKKVDKLAEASDA